MSRIIGGIAGGRRIAVPPGGQTRPTTDRVREALFSRLEHDGWLAGTAVLDLFAGSGALGLEAASRGAAQVLFVERNPAAAKLIATTARALGLAELSVVRSESVERVLAAGPAGGQRYDLVLADPPYPLPDAELAAILAALPAQGWLARSALVVVERGARSPAPSWPAGLDLIGERRYGEARLWFGQTPVD